MTEPTFAADLAGLTNEMAASRAGLLSTVRALSDVDLAKVRRGGWPIHRVLEHVIESEWLYATLVAHLQGKPVPERGKSSCEGQAVDDVLGMLDASRSALLSTLEGVDEGVFYDVQRMGHEEYSVFSVLENVVNHDREHTGQIATIVAAS
jgi:uncharacterized damage-inducible protein DinB